MVIESLPEPLRKLAREELGAGERARWVGQPSPNMGPLRRASLAPMVMGAAVIAFMLFWMGSAAGVFTSAGGADPAPVQYGRYGFALLGLPGLAAGVAMLAAPLWMPGRVRATARRTAYVITDRRVIIFDGGYAGDRGLAGLLLGMKGSWAKGKGTTVRSYPPEKLTHIERTQHDDGSGDVTFHEEEQPAAEAGEPPAAYDEGFFSVPKVKEVEELLRELAKTAKGP